MVGPRNTTHPDAMDTDTDNPCADLIPDEKGMPIAWARVIVYVDEEGEENSSVDFMPDTSFISVLGAVDVLRERVMRPLREAWQEQEEEDG